MKNLVAVLVIALVAACGCKHKDGGTTPEGGGSGTGSGTGMGTGTGSAEQMDYSKLGQPCGEDDACPAGTTCVSYLGIAGGNGPTFKSCEIKCEDKGAACPEGTACAHIADGPGAVCRPSS